MQRDHDSKPLSVLVVEDDRTFLSFWHRILDDLGIVDYELVTDPTEAARILKERSCQLLISDIIMPAVNGCELARLAKRHQPDCGIILTTAYGTDLARFQLDGIRIHLLHKPYTNIAELKRMVTHLLNRDESFDDISEDSFSDDEELPLVTNWKL